VKNLYVLAAVLFFILIIALVGFVVSCKMHSSKMRKQEVDDDSSTLDGVSQDEAIIIESDSTGLNNINC
jgi:hypothetical protein